MNRLGHLRAGWTRRTLRQRLILLALAPAATGLVVATSTACHTTVPEWLRILDAVAVLLPTVALAAATTRRTLNASLRLSAGLLVLACTVGVAISAVGLYAGGLAGLAGLALLLLLTDPAQLTAYLASGDLLIRSARWAWQPRAH